MSKLFFLRIWFLFQLFFISCVSISIASEEEMRRSLDARMQEISEAASGLTRVVQADRTDVDERAALLLSVNPGEYRERVVASERIIAERRERELDGVPAALRGIPVMPPLGERRKIIALSIDGGGVRGLLPALILQRIEELAGRPAIDMIDMVGGTSIGGILALGLSLPQAGGRPHNAAYFVDLIRRERREIFQSDLFTSAARVVSSPYSVLPLEGMLKREFGNATLTDVVKPVLVTSVTTTHQPRTWTQRKVGVHGNRFLWEIARATSAAPTYFSAAHVGGEQHLDGGLYANHPACLIHDEMRQIFPTREEDFVVLSLGTGESPLPPMPESVGISSVDLIIKSMMTLQARSVDESLREKMGNRYIRLQTFSGVDLADTGDSSVDYLVAAAARFEETIRPLVRFLVDNSQR